MFTYIGYAPLYEAVHVVAGQDRRLDVRLTQEALRSKVVVIRADSMRTSQKLYRKPISEVRLSKAQINAVPQVAEADLLRTLQNLPGVLPLSDFSSALYVRGGTPDQNLYMIDGTDVYNPEHAFGIFSTFNTDAIKQVELSKGGFGAQYGGRLSSVLGHRLHQSVVGQDHAADTHRRARLVVRIDPALPTSTRPRGGPSMTSPSTTSTTAT